MNILRLLNAALGVSALGLTMTPGASAAIADYTGSYEALLVSGAGLNARPVGKLELTVTKTGGFSGKLTAKEPKTFAFSGSLDEAEGAAIIKPSKGSSARNVQIVRGKGIANYVLTFGISADGALSAQLTSTGLSASAEDGVRCKVFAAKETADWQGAYTMALASPEKLSGALNKPTPTGSGYATMTVDAKKGVLKYTGKLADGTKVTGSLPPGQNRDYRLFLNPYKTEDSYLAGRLAIAALESGGFAGEEARELFWRKAPAAKPAVFTEGFGPVGVSARIAAWKPPGKGETLPGILGVENKQFSFDAFGDSNPALRYPSRLPAALTLDKAGNLLPVFGDALAPKDAKEWKKLWTGKVDAKTGLFTATLKVVDFASGASAPGSAANGSDGGARHAAAKLVNRTIKLEGVLLRTPGASGVAARTTLERAWFEIMGYYELVASGALGPVFGGVEGADEVGEVGAGAPSPTAIAPGTPGTYSVVVRTTVAVDMTMIPTGTPGFSLISQEPAPTALPNGSTVRFIISPDLGKLTWDGRVLPLAGDDRVSGGIFGGHLVYADTTKPGAKTPQKDSLVVTLTLDGEGKVSRLDATHIFLLAAKWRINTPAQVIGGRKIPAVNTTANAFAPAMHTYSNVGTPVKVP